MDYNKIDHLFAFQELSECLPYFLNTWTIAFELELIFFQMFALRIQWKTINFSYLERFPSLPAQISARRISIDNYHALNAVPFIL